MTAWRCVVRDLAQLGGDAEIGRHTCHTPQAVDEARRLGLIARKEGQHPQRGGRVRYVLTDLGREYLRGAVMQSRQRPGGRRWVATWLRALPSDVRIGAPPDVVL